ncbi:uroporphyrinogen-III C-methyltransferase [Colwellia chukchiensis]|uniref:uroporphyrinogen-III C-methyltransferase n=1 Tax=Colwellia chukchiensis TaxID=641665 RepID=A0A1H7M3H1_9GAMM|nr:uroporphyrinogen-III C-methyltransferase [Colwellia chukchiensis]SEL05137.1 uroporphyrinogen-III C-methyltransferase [Colwellia chukchiensis]
MNQLTNINQNSASVLQNMKRQAHLAPGEVALVGAGPGDPELLTIRALRFIEQADVAIYDRLVSDEIMALLPADCERFYVGKEQAKHCVPQGKINELLVQYAQQGKKVLRLKGGDPFIFGRGGEEAEFLLQHGVSCHLCPGITAASGCTTYAGIPLTHRGVAQGCTFITGHMQNDGQLNLPWQSLSCSSQTVVFYMGINTLASITEQLIKHGRDAKTPAALIRKGTQPEQQIFRGDIASLSALVEQHKITPPTLIIIGDVVNQLTDTTLTKPGFLDAAHYQAQMQLAAKVG